MFQNGVYSSNFDIKSMILYDKFPLLIASYSRANKIFYPLNSNPKSTSALPKVERHSRILKYFFNILLGCSPTLNKNPADNFLC